VRPRDHRAALGAFSMDQEPGACISRELENRPELKGRFTLTRSTLLVSMSAVLATLFQGGMDLVHSTFGVSLL
jgi:hypothetical protein